MTTATLARRLERLEEIREAEYRARWQAGIDTRDALNQRQPFVFELPERPRQAAFYVIWNTPGPSTVHLVVEDDCGPWRTFVGAGSNAF